MTQNFLSPASIAAAAAAAAPAAAEGLNVIVEPIQKRDDRLE